MVLAWRNLVRVRYSVPTGTDVLGDEKSVPENSEIRA